MLFPYPQRVVGNISFEIALSIRRLIKHKYMQDKCKNPKKGAYPLLYNFKIF